MKQVKIHCDTISEMTKVQETGKVELILDNPNIKELIEINKDDLIDALDLDEAQFKRLMEKNEDNHFDYFKDNMEELHTICEALGCVLIKQ